MARWRCMYHLHTCIQSLIERHQQENRVEGFPVKNTTFWEYITLFPGFPGFLTKKIELRIIVIISNHKMTF